MAVTQDTGLAGHLPACAGDDPVHCSCGDTAADGFLPHIASLLGTDETAARAALLEAHDNVEVNPGMCAGCETCGDSSAGAFCQICGFNYDPCFAHFLATEGQE
ncbi:hypothetical protein [Paenarthrobacter sp. YJN-5]|uniref:hypothetical protein n=1 Tax=Paenarthrobacter sp. YJN-5 TaxID=2735316 RepID=UPI001877C5A0|nr:hypothetical protein [Paenarthrobacter sp. YJN-5]QOT19261.1 hypothetical protein HMI59_21365 [Paenarthrobacter sp. YJN-5]